MTTPAPRHDGRKSVLITGCTPGGIGYSLALEFHSHGYRVFATARSPSTISSLAALGIETLALELHDPQTIRSLQSQIRSLTNGRGLDILVNNAGKNDTMPALELDMDEVQKTFDVNVFGVMRMCQAFGPMVVQAKGIIVMIGSIVAVTPCVFGSSYNASKAAMHAYSDTLRVELEPFGVRVITVVTGGVKSNIFRSGRGLSRDSLYLPVEAEFERRLNYSQEGAMATAEYAKSVVNHLLKKQPKKYVWQGRKSWLVWFAYTFLPRRVMDLYMYRT
ncbi:hypothetical protein GJ744_010350 [Endocarpon pusillum]|uniref:NADPH-dependent 1-acyldihydroxyacetone phosphate reductase n=1 Tax=Endocarpon pusillum TaxID=364733 RepID=A0A8H7AHJ6_9EURO|nr:hypothetical protein GJ744_010350 [Endocarpon pusillum]